MKKAIDGNFNDSTQAMWDFLMSATAWDQCNLYLIGELGHPNCLMLTDYPQALTWGPGTFIPAPIGTLAQDQNGSRVVVESKIGLDTVSVTIEYAASPDLKKLARSGYFDNWRVRIWRCIMPTPGDASTLGCYELFGGFIPSGGAVIDQNKISWTVSSLTALLDQKVPANVIENTNVLSSYAGATPPPGFAKVPRFSVMEGSDATVLILDCTNFPGHVFDKNVLRNGWVMFDFPSTDNPDETLGGSWSVVAANEDYIDGDGHHHNKVTIYNALPSPPTAGADTCLVSAPYPVDASEGDDGAPIFKYVPSPETAA